MNRIRLVLFDMNNRIFEPYLAAIRGVLRALGLPSSYSICLRKQQWPRTRAPQSPEEPMHGRQIGFEDPVIHVK
jgi:hypothetical protein